MLQQRFLRMLEEQVIPALELAFDRLIGPDEWIEIDSLDLNLGYLNPNESEQIWAEKTIQAYLKALEKQLPKENTRRNSAVKQQTELLFYFLQHGVLPWWAVGQRLEDIVLAQIPALAPKLPKWFQSKRMLQRWVRRFDDGTQLQVFEWIAKQSLNETALPITLELWLACFPNVPARTLRNAYWENLWIAIPHSGDWAQRWLTQLFAQGFLDLPEGLDFRLKTVEQSFSAPFYRTWPPSIQTLWREAAQTLIRRDFYAIAVPKKKAVARKINAFIQRHLQQFPTEKEQWISLTEELSFPLHQKPTIWPVETQGNTPAEEPAERLWLTEPKGVFVPLAGIVLIHPFLPALFEQLGLLHNGQFLDPHAQERAVHVLYHLATGLHHPYEEELPLLKLLCGLPLETPIERELNLTETEQQEILHLLQTVPLHWKDLEGMEPNDLRGSFFIREGKLHQGDMGLYLTVEEKTWDILLNKLPWGLSPIMHSWMLELLWVEWV